MPKFLILQSPNKGNVGTITERSEDFYKPTFYKITDEELETFTAMNAHAKAAYIAEKLEAQMGTPLQDKKKVAPIVEVVERVEEPVLVEMPEIEVEEQLNEPINYMESSKAIIAESANEKQIGSVVETPKAKEKVKTVAKEVLKPKAKGRPKKTN